MRKFSALLVSAVIVLFTIPAFGASFKEVHKKAQKGDAQAQFDLGMMYVTGEGTKKNAREALQWLLKAAEQGHAQAQHAVGSMYYGGEGGVPKDDREAFKWFLKSAENGYIPAQCLIGIWYKNGHPEAGITPNRAEGVKWLKMAAEPRKGIKLSEAESISQEAAEEVLSTIPIMDEVPEILEDARKSIDNANLLLEAVKHDKEGNHEKSAEIYKQLAERGDETGEFLLALSFQYGEGIEQDKSEAFKWYKRSAEHGFAIAQNNLGIMYETGEVVQQDKTEAAKWYRKAAEQGHANAMFNLGAMYMSGEGVKQDKSEAFKWFLRAAESNNDAAYFNIALMYYNGEGVKKDYKKAAEWYRKAADYGITSAQINLGSMYYKGEGVKKNTKEAYNLWRMAESQGDKRASDLIKLYQDKEKKSKAKKIDIVKGLQDLNDVLHAFNSILNVFSGRMTTVSPQSAPPRRVTSSRTGKTYTARTTPRGDCPHCFGSRECPRCASTILRGSENHCRECGGSKICQWCQGYGTD